MEYKSEVRKIKETKKEQTAFYGKQSKEKRLIITRLWNEGKITKNEAAILAGFPTVGEKGNIYKIRHESP